MENVDEILNNAFNAMPTIFTSQEFNKEIIRLGHDKNLIRRNGGLSNYLMKYADNGSRFSKTWKKKQNEINCKVINNVLIDSYNEILDKAFTRMNNTFTSFEFAKKCIEFGYPSIIIKRKGLSNYLSKHAQNSKIYIKTWVKNKTNIIENNNKFDSSLIMNEDSLINYFDEKKCIEFLKSKGYKIQKEISKWEEI